MKHDNWPFNDAGEPLCTAEQYAAEQRADEDYEPEFDESTLVSFSELRQQILEECEERLGLYHPFAGEFDDILDRGTSIIDACKQVLAAIRNLADELDEVFVDPNDTTGAKPSERLIDAAWSLFDYGVNLDAHEVALRYRHLERTSGGAQ